MLFSKWTGFSNWGDENRLISNTKNDPGSGLQALPGDLVFPALPGLSGGAGNAGVQAEAGHQYGMIFVTPDVSVQFPHYNLHNHEYFRHSM